MPALLLNLANLAITLAKEITPSAADKSQPTFQYVGWSALKFPLFCCAADCTSSHLMANPPTAPRPYSEGPDPKDTAH
ncbi:hypothetical protein TSTA_016180 [Talaromyces stipitatus ATCC 10500]|uniref:Uncharacterized protein n=1 Tax=Talaromyces stipitatus (strain ATCC 10500 / CBS 375.48 / QM 6759 / NRRL 1006) TaxID=441959 RepID=B8MEB2_TALSN|nr:uncharacterized protein TSTA_016180 [Talaromyces stipitatus ATCC 10500]EED16539.1 hypothetical protein TSTA_016180 [Talaromyces stipitatus ATCC 10500]